MKKYIVKSLAVHGRGKKIFTNGDKVTEANFPPGNAEELVKQGHLIEDGEVDEDADLEPTINEDLSEEDLRQKEYSALVLEGKEANKNKDWKTTVDCLSKALDLIPGDEDVYYLLEKAKKKLAK